MVFVSTLSRNNQEQQLLLEQRQRRPTVVYRRDWRGSKPTTFLLGIFTVMEDVHRRRLIRETMLGKSLPDHVRSVLCSLQQHQQQQQLLLLQQQQETNSTTTTTTKAATSKCRIIYTFVVGGNPQANEEWTPHQEIPMTMDATKMLKHENDILYLNIRENMNSGKTPTWFQYASTLQPSYDYVAKADADTLISLPALLSHMEDALPPTTTKGNQPRIYGGYLNELDACGGAGNPVCDKVKGKVYMSGQFYWLSLELVRYVSSLSVQQQQQQRTFWHTNNEDVDLGFKVLSYPEPIQLMVCNGAQFWIHPLKDEEIWIETFRNRFVDQWMSVTTNNWRHGLYSPENNHHNEANPMVRSVLGTVRDLQKLPILLD